jgi:hypothetical protein
VPLDHAARDENRVDIDDSSLQDGGPDRVIDREQVRTVRAEQDDVRILARGDTSPVRWSRPHARAPSMVAAERMSRVVRSRCCGWVPASRCAWLSMPRWVESIDRMAPNMSPPMPVHTSIDKVGRSLAWISRRVGG